MTLRSRCEVLVPVVDEADWPSRLAGEERRMNRHDRRVLLLASEPSSGFRLDHHGLLIVELQCSLQGAMDVVGALQRADDPDGAVCFRERDCALRLDIQLLLQSNAKLTFHDEIRLPLRGRHIPLRYVDRAEDFGGAPDVGDRGGELVLDVDMTGRVLQRGPVRRGQQEDRLLLVPDLAPVRGQNRLVIPDQLDDVLPRDVVRAHHDDARPVEGGVQRERADRAARDRGPNGPAVPGPRHGDVVGVACAPRHLIGTLATGNGAADGREGSGTHVR